MTSGSRDGAIELRQVERTIDGVRVLAGVSFAIRPGEAVTLVGRSGAGKSTILRLIAGLDRPTAGEIWLGGTATNEPPHRRGIGMVFQRPALWPHLTVAENVAFGLSRWPKPAARARLDELLESTRVEALAKRRPHQLSGGEAQRVALARALAPRPRALLLDEPLAGLDPELHSEMLALFGRVHADSGTTLLYVTHDHDEARTIAERVIRIERGRVAYDGPWAEAPAAATSRFAAGVTAR